MLNSVNVKRLFVLLVAVTLAAGLSSCQNSNEVKLSAPKELFGNGMPDESPVICIVNGMEITQHDLEMRLREMPQALRSTYDGENSERRVLEFMITETMLAQTAAAEGLQADPAVAQQLISQWRVTMRDAYASLVIWRDLEPSPDEIQDYYNENKQSYYTQGSIKARHIQCDTRSDAEAAYAAIMAGGYDGLFANVAAKFSHNAKSLVQGGDLGWFSRKGFIPTLNYGPTFAQHVFDWDRGLHEPELIGGDWHVVEILNREPSRQLTIDEVRDRIVDDLTPSVRKRANEDYIAANRANTDIEYFGAYRPGEGRTAEELIRLAMMANTFERKIQLYDLLLLDYPDSEYAPVALFMTANLHIDTYGDTYTARGLLKRILRVYPESELIDQVNYMLENLGNPNFQTPQSIEELRELSR
jgi:peptidyl-prolyl cis-trans isomerase C